MLKANNLIQEGDILHANGKFEDALKKYNEALEFDPFFKTAFFRKILTESKLGIINKESFKSEIVSTLEHYKKSRWIYRGLIFNYRILDEKSLEKEKDHIVNNQDAFFLFSKGFQLIYKGELKKSIETLDMGLTIQPNYPNAWFAKGSCLDSQFMHKKAKIAYAEGMNSCINGNYFYENEPEGWNNFGYALGIVGRYPDAISAFDTALSIKIDQKFDIFDIKGIQEIALLNKAYSMNQIENFDEVFRICDTILSINPASKLSLDIKKLTSERINKQKNKKWWNFWN